MVVGGGRLLRSWDTNMGGLNWEAVLDTGRCVWLSLCADDPYSILTAGFVAERHSIEMDKDVRYFARWLTAHIVSLYFSFQAACFVAMQDTVKHVAVLKKAAISLHYLTNGHQKWVENLPDR